MDTLTTINNWVDEKFPLHHIKVKSRTFSYRTSGIAEGPVIVLLHGIGSASGSWAYQLENFSNHYLVIAWDAPGYGGSSILADKVPKSSDYATALVEFLGGLNVQPDILVGHSLGALMAGAYAANGGPIGTALVLADPANGYGAANQSVRDEKLAVRLANMENLGPGGLAVARASALLSSTASDEALAMVRWNMSKLRVDGHAQAAHMLNGANLISDANKYDGPTLVMCGGEDTVTPEEGCRRVAGAFLKAHYQTLQGVGHASYVEDPAQFDQAILSFVEGCHA